MTFEGGGNLIPDPTTDMCWNGWVYCMHDYIQLDRSFKQDHGQVLTEAHFVDIVHKSKLGKQHMVRWIHTNQGAPGFRRQYRIPPLVG